MSFEKKEQQSPTLIIVALIAVGLGIALFLFFSRGCDSSGSSSIPPSEVFQKRNAPERTSSPAAARAAPSASADALQWLVREKAPQYAREGAEKTSGPAFAADPAAASAAAPAPAAPTAAPPSAPDSLSAEDDAALKTAAGPWSAEKAREIGSKRGLLFILGKTLLSHPKLVGLVLNNDYVVKGFMSQDRVRRNCHDAASLANYLSDTQDSSGISLGLASVASSLNTPGSAQALFGSKLVSQVLDQCGSIKALTDNTTLIQQVATSNPQILSMMMDNRLVSALRVNPAAIGTLSSAQSALSQPATTP